MNIDIVVLGGAGELGANFSKLCIDKGYKVRIIDIVRKNEAWRLKWLGIQNDVEYVWKSTFDLNQKDICVSDIVLDCACQPDRPLGYLSPVHTLFNNLLGVTRTLECLNKSIIKDKPTILYPSSSNIFLGVPHDQQPLTEKTEPCPTNFYAWSKLAAEQLYQTYNRCFDMNNIVIRTGSCYGPGMRSDQMIAKCALTLLKEEEFIVRSPNASRTYTYTKDVMDFYDRLIEKIQSDKYFLISDDNIIHNGGNPEDIAYTSIVAAKTIHSIVNKSGYIIEGSYETGEVINGKPVMQWESSELAHKLLGWKPKYNFNDGLKETIDWIQNESNYL